MSTDLHYHRLNEVQAEVKDFLNNILTPEQSKSSSDLDTFYSQLATQLKSEQIIAYIIRQKNTPYAFVWLTHQNNQSQIYFQFQTQDPSPESHIQLLDLFYEELTTTISSQTINGYFLIPSLGKQDKYLSQLKKPGISVFARQDMQLILNDTNKQTNAKIVPEKPVTIQKWKKKYLDAISNIDYLAYQATPDKELIPELQDRELHNKNFLQMTKGAVGQFVKQASFILLLDNVPIGSILVSRLNKITALIPTISIHPDYHNNQFGSYLLQSAISELRKKKVERVLASITIQNQQALRIFAKFQFTPYQTHIDYSIKTNQH